MSRKQVKQAQPNWSPVVPNFCCFQLNFNPANTKFQKISPNGLGLANFLYFLSILAVFWLKNGQKTPKYKKSFFIAFSLLGNIYIPNFKKFHQTVWILAILFFAVFWLKNGQKRPKSKKSSFIAFSLLGSIYIPKWFGFWQIIFLAVFWLFFG